LTGKRTAEKTDKLEAQNLVSRNDATKDFISNRQLEIAGNSTSARMKAAFNCRIHGNTCFRFLFYTLRRRAVA
jgi:hypothetical protein